MMGSETHGKTITMWPGVYALLGTCNEEEGMGAEHHNGQFDVDDRVLKYGAAAHVAYAEAFLHSELDMTSKKYQGTFAQMYEEQGVPEEFVQYLRGERDELILK